MTNLKKGTYVCRELKSDGDHIIDRAPRPCGSPARIRMWYYRVNHDPSHHVNHLF